MEPRSLCHGPCFQVNLVAWLNLIHEVLHVRWSFLKYIFLFQTQASSMWQASYACIDSAIVNKQYLPRASTKSSAKG